MAQFNPKPKPRKKGLEDSLKDMNLYKKAYANAYKKYKTGQGYAGLGPQELNRRKYQAKMLTKKAEAKAIQYEGYAKAIANSSYVDIFGDEKWAREKAAGQRKIQSQFDNQYNKLMKGKVTGQKIKLDGYNRKQALAIYKNKLGR